MAMAKTFAEMQSLSEEELIQQHDQLISAPGGVQIGIQHYLDEIRSRRSSRINHSMRCMTLWIAGMTFVITIATIVNVVLLVR